MADDAVAGPSSLGRSAHGGTDAGPRVDSHGPENFAAGSSSTPADDGVFVFRDLVGTVVPVCACEYFSF